MNNRTVGIIATVITSICCGCTSIFTCLFSTIALMNGGQVDVNGAPTDMPAGLSIGLICLSVILLAIPVAVGFFTLRKKPAAAVAAPIPQDFGGPIPPAS